MDGELETRVANVMANERSEHGRQMKDLEKEMYDVNKDLAQVREVSDKRWKELSGMRSENQVYQRQVKQLMDEKAEMATELYTKLEHERVTCDHKVKEQ